MSLVIDTSSIPADNAGAGLPTAPGRNHGGDRSSPPLPGSAARGGPTRGQRRPGRHVVIVAWRDIASPQAGGSELLVDQLAAGLTARGDRVTLLCGGPSAAHGYDVVRSGGPYTQFLRRAARLLAAAPRVRCRRGSLQRHAVPGAAVVPQADDLHGQPRAYRLVAAAVPPAAVHGGPLPGAAGHAVGPPPQPGAHGVRVHRAGTGVTRGPARAHPHALPTALRRRARPPRAPPSRCSWRSAGSPSTSASTCCCGYGTGYARW